MKFNYYENLLEGLENLKSNNSKEDWDKIEINANNEDLLKADIHFNSTLKENLDPETNNTDDLYALWYPYVGKRIVDKETMIKVLEEEINRIKKGTAWNVGEGLAFRCIQAIDNNEPLVPSHDKSDDEWFKRLRYDE